MGGSVGSFNARTRLIFVDETLIASEAKLKHDASFRASFVEFIKGGTWTDSSSCKNLNISSCDSKSPNCSWKKYGYKSPFCSGGQNSKSSFSSKTWNTSMAVINPKPDVTSSYGKMVRDECYQTTSSHHLFKLDELRTILIAAMFPMYLKSIQRCDELSLTETDEEDRDSERNVIFESLAASPRHKSDRLQDWLHSAATMFDGVELDAYLADTSRSWITDYRLALASIPVSLAISSVDAAQEQTKIIYTNAFSSNLMNSNLHEAFAEDCSPGGANQLARAVFAGKRYKRSLTTPDGMCTLRALNPIFDAHNVHKYVLGLESFPFEPVEQEEDRLNDEPFQHIEDLLMILPALIRIFDLASTTTTVTATGRRE